MKQKSFSSKMVPGVAITAVAILLLTVFPVMAQGNEQASEPKDIVWIALVGSIIALVFCVFLAINILKKDEGTDEMKSIAAAVREGSNAF